MAPPPLHPVAHSLRIALACVCSLLAAVLLDLSFANVAVYCTYMTMVQFPVTIFQRGLERLAGRAVGIGLGLALAAVLADWPWLCLLVEGLLIWALFYVYHSGHLAYTFLNAGLFVGVMVEIGHAEPERATAAAGGLLAALAVGVAAAVLVSWLTAAESGVRVDPGGKPLWPIRMDWVSRALLTAVTTLATQVATRVLGLATEETIISVMIVLTVPDLPGLVQKGWMRVLGAVLGAGWALLSFALLAAAPRLTLLAAMLALGVYLAAYLARAVPAYAYGGVQMGLVIGMVLVTGPEHFGDVSTALTRAGAALLATAVATVAAGLWPWHPPAPA